MRHEIPHSKAFIAQRSAPPRTPLRVWLMFGLSAYIATTVVVVAYLLQH